MKRYLRRYRVHYTLDDGPDLVTTVHITDGYTSFEDIPEILAVSHFLGIAPEKTARIEISMVALIEKRTIK